MILESAIQNNSSSLGVQLENLLNALFPQVSLTPGSLMLCASNFIANFQTSGM